jgi:hypothetical protein
MRTDAVKTVDIFNGKIIVVGVVAIGNRVRITLAFDFEFLFPKFWRYVPIINLAEIPIGDHLKRTLRQPQSKKEKQQYE